MPHRGVPIQTLLLRLFMPAVLAATFLLAILVYQSLYATIIDRFDRKLATASALAGALVDPVDHDRLIAAAKAATVDATAVERSPSYRRNVEPMQRIRTRLGLTYLYTQTLNAAQGVTYILDGTTGDDHSPLGATDSLPVQTIAGLRRTQHDGSIYISPIEFQEQWGLLKTAAAPVYDESGRISATAGADVNISIIQIATQNALFTSALIGVASVLACIMVVLAIVRRVGRPIEALRLEALRIAAGDHAVPKIIDRPREVKRLSTRLADLVDGMIIAAATRRNTANDHERRANEAMLTGDADESLVSPAILLVDSESERVWWIGPRDKSVTARLAGRAMALLGEQIAAHPSLAARWQRLGDWQHGAGLVLDRRAATIAMIGDDAFDLVIDGESILLRKGERRSTANPSHIVLNIDGTAFPLDGGTSP